MYPVFEISDPPIVVANCLLTVDECTQLMRAAEGRFAPGLTVNMDDGSDRMHDGRVCDGMYFKKGENFFIESVERKLAKFAGVCQDRLENLQILKYERGGKYDPHFDFFDPECPATSKLMERGGQRVSTIIVYLREPFQGGDTVFPKLNLNIHPSVGMGVWFGYPNLEANTLHGGDPVTAGEKWILTTWIREREFH